MKKITLISKMVAMGIGMLSFLFIVYAVFFTDDIEEVSQNSEQLVASSENIQESWEELETLYFADADEKGWDTLTISNSQGEDRDYIKKNNQWIRKNNDSSKKEVKKVTTPVKKEIVGTNDKIIDKQAINNYITQFNTLIVRYNKELSGSTDLESRTYADMVKYNSSSVRSTGQAVLDNNVVYFKSLTELVIIFNKIIIKITPYAESDSILRYSDIASLFVEAQPHITQYNSSYDKMESLLGSFFSAQTSYLNNEASRLKDAINKEIQAQNEARQEQINSTTSSANAKIELCNSLVGQGRGIPSSIIDAQLRNAGCI